MNRILSAVTLERQLAVSQWPLLCPHTSCLWRVTLSHEVLPHVVHGCQVVCKPAGVALHTHNIDLLWRWPPQPGWLVLAEPAAVQPTELQACLDLRHVVRGHLAHHNLARLWALDLNAGATVRQSIRQAMCELDAQTGHTRRP